jgi:hypothetical protein
VSAPAIVYSECHPKRRAVRNGLCRECGQVASSPEEDPLPAIILRVEQRAGPEMPPACRKCGGLLIDRGGYSDCLLCGWTWHRTSRRVLRPPRGTVRQTEEARAISGRADRKR